MDEQTDLDLVTDHPFQPLSGWPDICGYQDLEGDWTCGYLADEHGERLEGAAKEVVPDETP